MATVHDLHPDPLHRCETALRLLLAQCIPDTRQALRAAVTANGANAGATPPTAPECATPRGGSVRLPLANGPFTAAHSAGCPSIGDHHMRQLIRKGAIASAQYRALLRWHGKTPVATLDRAIAVMPRFPLIDGVATPRAFAPVRGCPRPAA